MNTTSTHADSSTSLAIRDLVSKVSWVIILEEEEYQVKYQYKVTSFGKHLKPHVHTGNSDAVNIANIHYYIQLC